jgi:hypothetical protein
LIAQQPLTNESVIKMVKAGLGEAVILPAISTQSSNFSVATDDLIALKTAGVGDSVIAAMIAKSGDAAQRPAASTQDEPITDETRNLLAPHDSGIYLYTTKRDGRPEMIMLERAAYQGAKTGGLLASSITYGIKKAKTKAIIPGARATIRVTDDRPVFYFYFDGKATGLGRTSFGVANLSNPNQFALVKLDVEKSTRETVVGSYNAWGSTAGTDPKSIISFKSERMRPGLYRVEVSERLLPGEYCFLASGVVVSTYGVAQTHTIDMFDFGKNPD